MFSLPRRVFDLEGGILLWKEREGDTHPSPSPSPFDKLRTGPNPLLARVESSTFKGEGEKVSG